MSTRAEEESLPSDTLTPTQESIEGAGLYDPNINRLPDSSETERHLTEDRELRAFSDTIHETTALLIRDTLERTTKQYTKVIKWYRKQVDTLRKEHEAEKCHLERQIKQEKS